MTADAETRAPVRVLVVDDSAFMRTALAKMISADSDLEVAATACSGSDALEKIAALDPDIVTLDIQMPGLDGLETLRCIMSQFPRPVIMVSSVSEKDAENTFKALAAGAFDYVPKQLSPTSLDILHIRSDLIAKIRAAAQQRRPAPGGLSPRKPPRATPPVPSAEASPTTRAIVALATSTGGPKALEQILPRFPRDLSVPILIVQHMPHGFTAPFADRLNSMCSVTVHEAIHGERIYPGHVYIAPAGTHMTVERAADAKVILSLNSHPENSIHIPSADVMMQSVAKVYGHLALGVIMTGMGSDGAAGMEAIFRRGGLTIGQDEATCAVYGMPRACAELGVLTHVVPLSQIPAQILQATRQRRRA